MKFIKMHGLGNDFVVVDGFAERIPAAEYPSLAREVCDRHFGIGADGLIFVLPSDRADFRMRIFNADGSEAEMCGNGVRCFARCLHEQGFTRAEALVIETATALNPVRIRLRGGEVERVRVDMGEPRFLRGEIPMTGSPAEEAVGHRLELPDRVLQVTGLAVGNPHCVTFVEDAEAYPVTEVGPRVERHSDFPRRTNVEFVQVLGPGELRMRVWERGVGPTLACGSGACASLAAAARNGLTGREATVHLDGGELEIEWSADNHLYMSGPAATVFTGEYQRAGQRAELASGAAR